jgi:DNA-binding transcriptional ArsR family regulator
MKHLPGYGDLLRGDSATATWLSKKARRMFKELDPILHSQLRLAVVSLLVAEKEAGFTLLKEKTNATAGNLSVQIQKLKDAGYIDIIKSFKDNYPQTVCKITREGVTAYTIYVKNLQSYLGAKKIK